MNTADLSRALSSFLPRLSPSPGEARPLLLSLWSHSGLNRQVFSWPGRKFEERGSGNPAGAAKTAAGGPGRPWSVKQLACLPRVTEGGCGPGVARFSDFYRRSQNIHILVEILQILKHWPKKNSSFRTALANICGSDQPMGGQFQVMAVCSSIFVFDLTSPFMFSFSSALGKWPRPTRSRTPSGCSNALHIEGT